jgi:predicted metal-dependent hydrolase
MIKRRSPASNIAFAREAIRGCADKPCADSYALRTGVMIVAVVGFYLYFMAQDKSLFNPKEWSTMYDVFFGKYDLARKTFVKFLEYYKPHFHPWDNQNYHLAQPTLAKYENQAS